MESDRTQLPPEIAATLTELVAVLDRHKIAYAVIGGVAAGFLARPRFTEDLDLVLRIPQIALPGLLQSLAERGFRFDEMTAIRQWTQEHVAVLHSGDVQVDLLKPIISCYEHVIDRARIATFLGAKVRFASVENLIVTKLLAYRRQDLLDIEQLLYANRGQLDIAYIRSEWETVYEANDPRMLAFEEMLQTTYTPLPNGTAPLPAHKSNEADASRPHDGSSP
jgi:predicted nucleotidyltransferase